MSPHGNYSNFGPPVPFSQHPGHQWTPDTEWGFFSKDQVLAKRSVIPFETLTTATAAQSGTVDILNVRAKAEYAQQVCLAIAAPKFVAAESSIDDVQRLTGEQDNIDMSSTIGNLGGSEINPSKAFNIAWPNPIIVVEWGIGGISNRAEIDCHNGLCVNLSCAFIRVKGYIDLTQEGAQSGCYVLTAQVGPGFPKPNNAQRTINLGNPIPSGEESGVFCVPRFAKSVYLCGANEAGTDFTGTIKFWRTSGGPADKRYVAQYVFDGNTPGSIPIPNGAYYFSVVAGIAIPNHHQAIFELAI